MKKYIYLSSDHSISYNSENWYINDIPQEKENSIPEELIIKNAEDEAKKLVIKDICTFFAYFANIGILTAAGTSMENGSHGGKTRTELWSSYSAEIDAIKDQIVSKGGHVATQCLDIIESKNIENFLSFTILYEKLNGELLDDKGNSLKLNLENKIAEACRLVLDKDNQHHQDFIKKITARKPGASRVQLYTTNYDTLFEEAAARLNYTIIDGFSFSYPRIFNGANFDRDIVFRERTRINQEESFIPGVLQMFKLHGSVDWEKSIEGKIFQKELVKHPCIIYPASDKFESSYEQPYFEMMAHLQQTLRRESTFFMIAGFGFQDKHIQNVIHEAAIQNPNFHLLIICYGSSPFKDENGDEKWDNIGITNYLVPGYLKDPSTPIPNVTILFSKFKNFVEIYPLNPSYLPHNLEEKNEPF